MKNAILSIYAGAGGVDACDWAEMLLRMYQRYCQQKGYRFKILEESFGKEAGIKSVICEIVDGYDKLKNEAGVHRLVRQSPFSAKKLRHTSFALVEVLPEMERVKVEINPKDLRIDTYRATGPGGQYVNKTSSAVRITHLPTGIFVACQSERSQAQNKERAMMLLQTKLYQREKSKIQQQQVALRTGLSAEWGNQIRSYVLHPYKMVKDHRSGKKIADVKGILDGNLDDFI